MTTSVAHRQARHALGVQAAAQALGLALGPTVGGLLIATAGWRWVFWVNVPVGVVAYVLGTVFIPRTRHLHPSRRLDVAGTVLVAVAGTAVLAACSGVSGAGWPAWVAATLAVVGVVAAALLVTVERRVAAPLLDRRLLGQARARRGLLGALLAYLVLFGPLVLVPVELARLGTGSGRTGLLLTTLPVGFALTALAAGVLPASLGNRARVRLGGAVAAAGLVTMAVAPATTAWLPVALVVTGLGIGLVTPANNATIMAAAPVEASGSAGGLINLARAYGTALGVALVSLCLTAVAGAGGASLAAAALAVAAVLLALSAA